MRVKSILPIFLSFFLFSFVAFSQQGGSKNGPKLNEILRIVEYQSVTAVNRLILNLGYEASAENEFTNGYHKFRLVPGNFGLVYSEDYQSQSRSKSLQSEALKSGFEIAKDSKIELILKSGNYEMVIGLRKIEIKRSIKK